MSASARQCRGVVLQPHQPPRSVQPDAAQEADLADRAADVCRQPSTGRQDQQHRTDRGVEPDDNEDDSADVTQAKDCPGHRVRDSRPPARPRHGQGTSVATPYDADRPSRRRCPRPAPLSRAKHCRLANMCAASRLCWANRSSTCRSTPGRHAELSTVGSAKTASSISRGSMLVSSTIVITTRTIQRIVSSSDRYM